MHSITTTIYLQNAFGPRKVTVLSKTEKEHNIIVCNYIFIDIPEVEEVQAVEAAPGRSAETAVKGRPAVHKIIMTLISNFDIKPLSYLNFIIYNNIISSVDSLK
jgi:hypothetical protein